MGNNKSKKVELKNPFELQQKTRKKSTVADELAHFKDVFKRYIPLSEISNDIAKELIGKYAYKDADVSKKSYENIMDEGLTFFMSTDTGLKRTGLLSLFPALSTGIRLYSKMPESVEKKELLKKMESGIEAVFKFIYRVKKDANWREDKNRKPVFDASPYESEAFYPERNDKKGLKGGRSYIDSISWAVPLFLDIIYLTDENKKFVFDKDYREEAKVLIEWCLRYVNEAVLTIEDENKNDNNRVFKRPVGWNFSKIVPFSQKEEVKAQSSLYFTYAAASMYLAFYEVYKDIIDDLQTLNRAYDKKLTSLVTSLAASLRKEGFEKDYKEFFDKRAYDKIVEKLKEEGKLEEEAKLLEKLKKMEKVILLKEDSNFNIVEKEISALAQTLNDDEKAKDLYEAFDRLKKYKGNRNKLDDYYFFNDGKSAQYNGKIYTGFKNIEELELGPISQLKWNLEKISDYIWENGKDKLEDNFVYDDFNFTVATPAAIESGGQTNALFAGLLHISICLYSKYDFVVYYTESDDSEKFGKKAFDNMQNIMLLHTQKAQRFFDRLSEKDKAFGVDFLILRFSENFNDDDDNEDSNFTDRETAERLRKQLIRITSLTPMLLKTNNLISQYVVQYPQKQMGQSIIKIGEKRFYDRKLQTEDENEKYRWFWESDGYHAMSNYYYIGAIFDFYKYYDNYEYKYIGNLEELKENLIKDAKYTKSIQEYYQEAADDMERLKEEHKQALEAKEEEMQAERDRAKKNEIGEKLYEDIKELVKKVEYFDEPEFLERIINGLRKQLAKEIFERYKNKNQNEEDLEKLKKPIEPKNRSLFSLLQALVADIVLQSAIEEKKNDVGEVNDGFGSFNGYKLAKVASIGGKQLIEEGLINRLIEKACISQMKWNELKKTK